MNHDPLAQMLDELGPDMLAMDAATRADLTLPAKCDPAHRIADYCAVFDDAGRLALGFEQVSIDYSVYSARWSTGCEIPTHALAMVERDGQSLDVRITITGHDCSRMRATYRVEVA